MAAGVLAVAVSAPVAEAAAAAALAAAEAAEAAAEAAEEPLLPPPPPPADLELPAEEWPRPPPPLMMFEKKEPNGFCMPAASSLQASRHDQPQ